MAEPFEFAFFFLTSFTVPEDGSHTSIHRSLHLESVLPHPPNNPDLAPSDFLLLGPLKDALLGHPFGDEDDELKQVFIKCSDASAKNVT